jgi:phage shock protein PspC (stress-responsive transcriptional regulator)
MPTLIRLIFWLAAIAGLAFGVMWALATFVQPNRVETVIEVPVEQLRQARPAP